MIVKKIQLGCIKAALHFFVKQIPPITDFWHQVDSDRCNSHLLMPAVIPCFTAGKIILVWNCHDAWRHPKSTICICIVYAACAVKATSSVLLIILNLISSYLFIEKRRFLLQLFSYSRLLQTPLESGVAQNGFNDSYVLFLWPSLSFFCLHNSSLPVLSPSLAHWTSFPL